MEKLTDFFKKKKLQAKFKTAGPGHKLSESRSSQPQPQPPQQKHVPREQKTSSASSAAGAAALKRFEQPSRQTNKALGLVMEEEKKRILAEMKAKEEAQALKEQTQEVAPVIVKKYVCPILGINEGYPLTELKEMIEEGIRASYEDDTLLMSALLIKNCNDDNATQICVRTLELVLDNLRTDDEMQLEKFKKLKKAKIQSKILDVKGGREFLNAVGFIVDDSDEWCTLHCENSEIK
ncbi:UBX domain-containing protein 6-like protein, partial [Leptotrombidium deliense]